MIRADIITLISEDPAMHGAFDSYSEGETVVKAEILSVSRSEAYAAKSANLEPEYIFRLANFRDYADQRKATWNGSTWRVVRAYVVNGQTVELTVQREV